MNVPTYADTLFITDAAIKKALLHAASLAVGVNDASRALSGL